MFKIVQKNYFVLSIIILFSSLKVHAQTNHFFSGWAAVFSSTKVSDRISIHFDAQVRSNDQWQEVQQILIRPGIHYQVKKNQIATLGYAYVNQTRTVGGIQGRAPEHRIWEQYIINQSFAISGHATSLQHRLRLEQRFISKSIVSNNELKTDGYSFAQRLRYFARSVFPLKQTSKFQKGTFISLQDEVMVNIGDASAVNGKFFDQNRAYGSIGYRFSPKADLEAGYMYQYILGRGNSRTNNDILQLALYLRL